MGSSRQDEIVAIVRFLRFFEAAFATKAEIDLTQRAVELSLQEFSELKKLVGITK